MNFVNHSKLSGLHAPFSPSQPAWLRYSDEKAITVRQNKKAAELGTRLHAWAKETIDMFRISRGYVCSHRVSWK